MLPWLPRTQAAELRLALAASPSAGAGASTSSEAEPWFPRSNRFPAEGKRLDFRHLSKQQSAGA